MINEFLHEDNTIETKVDVIGTGFAVTIGGNIYRINEIAPDKFNVDFNGLSQTVCCVVKDDKSYLDIDGVLLELSLPSDDGNVAGKTGITGEKDKIFAPMPGKIVKLLVKDGETVKKKQPMVIVEAMKMEHQVNSLADGKVKAIYFADGDQVDTETPIIELDIEE